jgi:multicomponent Na+:H+ antiporter subunit F
VPVTVALYSVALVLVLSMLTGLVRAALGPTPADRLSAALLLGSTGVGLLVVLSAVTGTSTLRDVALVLVVLSALVVVVFVGDVVTGRREDEP